MIPAPEGIVAYYESKDGTRNAGVRVVAFESNGSALVVNHYALSLASTFKPFPNSKFIKLIDRK